jgi:hypothetical protein
MRPLAVGIEADGVDPVLAVAARGVVRAANRSEPAAIAHRLRY